MAKLGEAISAAAWGEEILKGDTDGTSEENETSIVQFSDVYERKVLLTGDAGVRALTEAHQSAVAMGKSTSELDWFQVPHHGSRRNLSSDVLDTWLGGKANRANGLYFDPRHNFGEPERHGTPQEGGGASLDPPRPASNPD